MDSAARFSRLAPAALCVAAEAPRAVRRDHRAALTVHLKVDATKTSPASASAPAASTYRLCWLNHCTDGGTRPELPCVLGALLPEDDLAGRGQRLDRAD